MDCTSHSITFCICISKIALFKMKDIRNLFWTIQLKKTKRPASERMCTSAIGNSLGLVSPAKAWVMTVQLLLSMAHWVTATTCCSVAGLKPLFTLEQCSFVQPGFNPFALHLLPSYLRTTASHPSWFSAPNALQLPLPVAAVGPEADV